jgi:alpha-tubulin suppressor-like RCC1 family protein
MLFLKNIPITKQSTKKNWRIGLIIALLTIFLLSSTLLLFRFYFSQGQVSAAPTPAIVSFGSNANGLLGNGTDSNVYSHLQASNISNITQVSVGYQHSLALRSDGTVWGWGSNGERQLGQDTAAPTSTAIEIPNLNNIVKIVAAYDGSYALQSNGVLWKWGNRPHDGGVILTPTQVAGLPPIIDFDATKDFQIGVTSLGQVYTWGYNAFGHSGNGTLLPTTLTTPTINTTISGVKKVSIDGQINLGRSHILALKTDNTLWAWGVGATTFTNCSVSNTLLITGVGATCAIPSQVLDPTATSGFLENVKEITNGGKNNYAIRNDNSIYVWSKFSGNSVPTLDTALTALTLTQINEKGFSTIGITSANQSYVWGTNTFGQLGVGPLSSTVNTPTILPITGAVSAASGINHSLILNASGIVFGSGDNGNKQVGNNSSSTNAITPTNVNSSSLNQGNIVKIITGEDHVLALRNDGTVWTWGNNEFGQLGIGSTIPRSLIPVQIPTLTNVTDISTSTTIGDGIGDGFQGSISIALRNDGTAWVWGGNNRGQLGNGTTTPSNIPIQYGAFNNVVQIHANERNVGVRLADGTLRVSGDNTLRQLGDSAVVSSFSNAIVTPGITNVVNFQFSGLATYFVKNDGSLHLAGVRDLAQNISSTPIPFIGTNTISLPVTNSGCSFFCTFENGTGAPYLVNSFNTAGTDLVPLGQIPVTTNLSQAYYTFYNSRFSWTDTNNIFYSSGNNSFGQAGNGTLSSSSTPAVNFSATTLVGGGNNVSYAAGIFVPPITDGQISPTDFDCEPESVDSTTSCSFELPLGFSLPVNFKMGINTAIPGGSCAQDNYNYTVPVPVTCTGVPTGSQAGLQPIFAQIGTNTPVNTGETVLIGAQDVQDGNIQSGNCTPNPVTIESTSNCTFPLTGNTVYTMPSGGLRAGITNTSGNTSTYIGDSQPCTISGTNLVCNAVPTNTSTVLGSRELVIKELTTPNPTYYFGKGTLTVNARPLNPTTDLPNLNSLSNLTCTPSNTVANSTVTCNGTLPNYISPPSSPNDLKLNVEGSTSVNCVFAGQIFTCSNMGVGGTTGIRNIQAAIGPAVAQNTGETITIGTAISDGNIGASTTCNTVDQVTIGSTFTCDFPIIGTTGAIILPTGGIVARTQQGVNNSANSSACSVAISQPVLTCTNIPTTGGSGTFNVANADVALQFGGAGNYFDKGDVNLITSFSGAKTITPINTGTSTDCISTTSVFISTPLASCSISLIGNISNNYTLPTNGIVAKISTSSSQSSPCTISGNNTPQPRLVCTSIPSTGGSAGPQDLLLSINNSAQSVDRSNITLTNTSPVTEVTSTDIPNLKSTTNFNCVPDSVLVNSNVSCSGTLPQLKKPPTAGMRVRVEGVNQSISCVFASQNAGATFICSGLPVGVTTGTRNIQAAIGATAFENINTIFSIMSGSIGVSAQTNTQYSNTGETIIVTPAIIPTVTPRTGGFFISVIALAATSIGVASLIYISQRQKKINTK